MPVSGGLQFLNPQEVIAKAKIISGMKVADLGAGNLGYFVLPCAKLVGKEGLVFAVDIQKAVLEGIKSKAKLEGFYNIEYVWADLEKIGSTQIPEQSLDVVFLVNVLFQNKKRQEMLQEAARLMKPGARLIVIDWKKIAVAFGPAIELRVDPEQIKLFAQASGLRLEEEVEFGDYFWGLIFTKNS